MKMSEMSDFQKDILTKEDLLKIFEVQQRLEDIEQKYNLIKEMLDRIFKLEKKVSILQEQVAELHGM